MMEIEKIIVLAGDREQFQNWLRYCIIPVTSKEDVRRLRGVRVSRVYTEGTYYRWFDAECEDYLRALSL